MKTKVLFAAVAFAALSSMTFAQAQPKTSTAPVKEKTEITKAKDSKAVKHQKTSKAAIAAKKAEKSQKATPSK